MKNNILTILINRLYRVIEKVLSQNRSDAVNRTFVKQEIEDVKKLNCDFEVYPGVSLIPSNDFSYYD